MGSKRVVSAVVVCAALVGGLAVAALMFVSLSGSAYEVRGDAKMPYESGKVKEVRFADSVTVYVDEESQPSSGRLGGVALLILATAALMTSLVLRRVGGRRRLVTFYALIAAGLGFAAHDETFAIHETVGHNLQFRADLPGVTRPDDVVIALYIPLALGFAWYFRDEIASHPRAPLALAVALGFFVLSVGADVAGQMALEAVLEVCSGLCITVFLVALMRKDLREHLPPAVEAPDEVTVVDQRARPARVPAGT